MTKLGNSDLVDLELVFLGETDKAFRVGYGDVTLWLPRSLVERDGNTFTMPEWLAIEKELV